MMHYPEEQENDYDPDMEGYGAQTLYMDQLEANLNEDNDLDDDLDRRVDEVRGRRRKKVTRGGLFGV